jgi:hypothetical protein
MAALGAILAACLAAPLYAGGDSEINFAGDPDLPALTVPAESRAGETLWDSGASLPVDDDFSGLLVEGQSEDPRLILEASVRGSKGWGPWAAAEIRRLPNGRFWGRIPATGLAGAVVRLRLVNRGSAAGKRFELFNFELDAQVTIQSRRRFKPAAATGPAPIPAEPPPMISRQEWNAAPPTEPYEPMTPAMITVHHTQAAQPRELSDALTEIHIIQQYHMSGRHWDDIGYHFMIDGAGRIYACRPLNAVGAHVAEHNPDNVGIAIMGNFTRKDSRPFPEQLESLKRLVRYLRAAYGIGPEKIVGHRDLAPKKKCPGESLYRQLPKLRAPLDRARAGQTAMDWAPEAVLPW